MKKGSIVSAMTILYLLILSFNTFSQDYKEDSLAVRAILDSNGLTTVTVEEVSKVGNNRIDTLTLDGRSVTTLPAVIGNITKLVYLDLNDNSLQSIPSEIGNCTDLVFFDISYNDLTSLPATIGQMTKLVFFNCLSNKISVIPAEIGSLVALDRLYFSNNKITSIPSEIGNLVNLRRLYLEDNDITSIPSTVGTMAGLDILSLSRNKISGIPKEIGQATGLQSFTLSNNEISSVPSEIGKLSVLNTFTIDHNKLTTLPDSVTFLVPFQNLDLGFNYLNKSNLSDTVISWADQYDPGWDSTQSVGIINIITEQISKSISIIYSQKILQVHFNLLSRNHIKLDVIDAKGKIINTLLNAHKTAGQHVVPMRPDNYSSGIYYLRFTVGKYGVVKKTVVLK